jgi:hypothetical protein
MIKDRNWHDIEHFEKYILAKDWGIPFCALKFISQ